MKLLIKRVYCSQIGLKLLPAHVGRLSEWQSPTEIGDLDISLEAWVKGLGRRYTGRPFYNANCKTTTSAVIHEISYLGKSLKRRILHRLEQ